MFALDTFLKKYCNINESLETVQLNSSYIFRVLRIVFENHTCVENQKKAANIINALIESAKISTADKYNVMLMLSDHELFSNVRLKRPENNDQYESVLKKFVESNDYGSIEHLKVLHQHVSYLALLSTLILQIFKTIFCRF